MEMDRVDKIADYFYCIYNVSPHYTESGTNLVYGTPGKVYSNEEQDKLMKLFNR